MNNPLVSFCVVTYNQERYVREAVASALEQTYSPLEVIISDDNSTDNTWRIIERTVADYTAKGISHKVVLNRNSENLGIAAHWDFVDSLCQGELKFMAAGDDISMRNRAEVVVAKWLEGNKAATAVVHSALTIDDQGAVVGELHATDIKNPVGAVIAWKRFPDLKYPPPLFGHAVEDLISAARARMLGDAIQIDDKLLYYRIGSGLSTVHRSYSETMRKMLHLAVDTLKNALSDIEFLKDKSLPGRYEELLLEYDARLKDVQDNIVLRESRDFSSRLNAFCRLHSRINFNKVFFLHLLLLLPVGLNGRISDLVYKLAKRSHG